MNCESQTTTRAVRQGLVICLLSSALAPFAVAHSPIPFGRDDARSEMASIHEDLTQLSIHGSQLKAEPVIPGGSTETASFTRELYQMQWRGGDPIDVYVIRPKGVSKPPVTIYLYGYPTDANRFRNDAFCDAVTRAGVAAIGFVPALIGQRYHGVPMRTWFVSELHDSVVKTVHDVQMIVNYAAERPDLDATRVGIFGQGAGATIAGLTATVDARIQAVDLLDPWGDWPTWMAGSRLIPEEERVAFLKPEYLDSLIPLDPVLWLPKLKGRALKLDDALFEKGTPVQSKARIEAALPASARLQRYETQADFERNALANGQLVAWLQDEVSLAPQRIVTGSQDMGAQVTNRH
jgi:cephalosporin-C deacetylase-like acetyl esterase